MTVLKLLEANYFNSFLEMNQPSACRLNEYFSFYKIKFYKNQGGQQKVWAKF